jgi:hypothetical protein
MQDKPFRLWTHGCAHVLADMKHGRESLADAFRHADCGGTEGGPPFDWDICINVGDFSANQGLPSDDEGAEIVRQFKALGHRRREQVYTIAGNHDRNGLDQAEGEWFRKWIDPMGENTDFSGVDRSRYRYPVHGSAERYWFEVGNIVFLMMSDVNERTQSKGRGTLGGNPGGAVTRDTFEWWVDMVERHGTDRIVVSVHHYVLKDTTVASGEWEGMIREPDGRWRGKYHRYFEDGTPNGASYLYWIGGQADSGLFERYLINHPGAVDIWLGGHTHTNPDDTTGGKSHIETKYGGTTFINTAALTRHHVAEYAMPHSRLLTFTEGSARVSVQCYMHTDEHRSQGWYREREKTISLSQPFSWNG